MTYRLDIDGHTYTAESMRSLLQLLRDHAESRCHASVDAGDGDSANAWEEVGLVLEEAQQGIKPQQAVIDARRGLMA